MYYESESEAKAKLVMLSLALVLVVALIAGCAYINSLDPEEITGAVLDREQVTTTYTHYSRDGGFWISSSTTYKVKISHSEGEETFSTDASTYAGIKVGDEGVFKVSGKKWAGRVLRGN